MAVEDIKPRGVMFPEKSEIELLIESLQELETKIQTKDNSNILEGLTSKEGSIPQNPTLSYLQANIGNLGLSVPIGFWMLHKDIEKGFGLTKDSLKDVAKNSGNSNNALEDMIRNLLNFGVEGGIKGLAKSLVPALKSLLPALGPALLSALPYAAIAASVAGLAYTGSLIFDHLKEEKARKAKEGADAVVTLKDKDGNDVSIIHADVENASKKRLFSNENSANTQEELIKILDDKNIETTEENIKLVAKEAARVEAKHTVELFKRDTDVIKNVLEEYKGLDLDNASKQDIDNLIDEELGTIKDTVSQVFSESNNIETVVNKMKDLAEKDIGEQGYNPLLESLAQDIGLTDNKSDKEYLKQAVYGLAEQLGASTEFKQKTETEPWQGVPYTMNEVQAYNDFLSIGENARKGFEVGLSNTEGVSLWTKDVINTVKTDLDIHSPSRVFQDIGANVVKGFNLGVSNAQLTPWTDSVKSSANEILDVFSNLHKNVNLTTGLTNLENKIQKTITLPEMTTDYSVKSSSYDDYRVRIMLDQLCKSSQAIVDGIASIYERLPELANVQTPTSHQQNIALNTNEIPG